MSCSTPPSSISVGDKLSASSSLGGCLKIGSSWRVFEEGSEKPSRDRKGAFLDPETRDSRVRLRSRCCAPHHKVRPSTRCCPACQGNPDRFLTGAARISLPTRSCPSTVWPSGRTRRARWRLEYRFLQRATTPCIVDDTFSRVARSS